MMPRYTMTDEEGEQLHSIVEDYWLAFSKLVAQTLDRCPKPELEALLLDKIEEHSSAHGSAYDQYRGGS
jgi:hypothetical protein